jgi:hypothetical protein
MKNLKQIALGLIVGAMAVGFSSFVNIHPKIEKKGFSSYLFYRKTTAPAHSTTASDYEYRPDGGCNSNNGTYCSAYFNQSSAPTIVGQAPTGTFSSVGTNNALWDGN